MPKYHVPITGPLTEAQVSMDAQETMPYDAQGEDEKGNENWTWWKGVRILRKNWTTKKILKSSLHEMPTGKDGKDQVTSKEEDQDGGIPPGQITPDVVETRFG